MIEVKLIAKFQHRNFVRRNAGVAMYGLACSRPCVVPAWAGLACARPCAVPRVQRSRSGPFFGTIIGLNLNSVLVSSRSTSVTVRSGLNFDLKFSNVTNF